MNNQPTNQNKSEELDLGYLFNKIGDFFRSIIKTLFLIIAFFQKYLVITVILIIIGIAYGYYKDQTKKKIYTNESIVIPNFESVDYLYGAVEALNYKMRTNDTIYLKTILDTNFHKIHSIEIEPIVDIYNFVSKSREHIDVFRILFQNQELSEFVEDMATSKYYKYHKIKYQIEGKNQSREIISGLMDHINNNDHYLEYMEASKENTELQIIENKNMIAQVDSVIKSSTSFASETSSNQSVYINDNSQLNDLLNTKMELLEDRLFLQMRQSDETNIVKTVSVNYNVAPEKKFSIPNKIKYPVLLLFLFGFIFFVKYTYFKMKEISESN